jgi:pimeloyl-ACP methyl ester carboxylesterase
METRHLLDVGTGCRQRQITVKTLAGESPGLVWLGGFRSDMEGIKALAMVDWAKKHGTAALRFDYSGHGQSGGDFRDGCISRWLEESLAVFRRHSQGPQIVLGSSMGAWIALRMVQELAIIGEGHRIKGLVLVAPAPDFTAALMEPSFSVEQQDTLKNQGYIEEPSAYADEPYIITNRVIEDGRNNLVLKDIIETNCPVRILQGMRDDDVPYDHALRLLNHLPAQEVTITLVKDGDHRLSRDQDIVLLKNTLGDLMA